MWSMLSASARFTHVGLNLSHGGTDVTCHIADATICNTQMDHTECTPSIQPPNTSYRPRFLQGDHHGNTNYNLHLAAVYYNSPDRNQCTGEKSKCLSWDCDWMVSIPSQVTTIYWYANDSCSTEICSIKHNALHLHVIAHKVHCTMAVTICPIRLHIQRFINHLYTSFRSE